MNMKSTLEENSWDSVHIMNSQPVHAVTEKYLSTKTKPTLSLLCDISHYNEF